MSESGGGERVVATAFSSAPGALPPDYFAGGYTGIAGFLAAIKGRDLMLFEPNSAASVDSGSITCTHEERRSGKRGLFHWLLQTLGTEPFDYFEFGVMSCRTFNRVIEASINREARFYGFDTFEGLPQPWVRELWDIPVGVGRAAGELKPQNAPAVYDSRATLFKGLFQDTLPEALDRAFPNGRQKNRPLFINIDSDLYSSALYALTSMHPLLRSDDYVYLDEFFDALNEFAAFNDYIRAYNAKGLFSPAARAYDGLLFRVSLPPVVDDSNRVIERRTTSYLGRLNAYARARASMWKGHAKANSP